MNEEIKAKIFKCMLDRARTIEKVHICEEKESEYYYYYTRRHYQLLQHFYNLLMCMIHSLGIL